MAKGFDKHLEMETVISFIHPMLCLFSNLVSLDKLLMQVGVARAILCHIVAMPLLVSRISVDLF